MHLNTPPHAVHPLLPPVHSLFTSLPLGMACLTRHAPFFWREKGLLGVVRSLGCLALFAPSFHWGTMTMSCLALEFSITAIPLIYVWTHTNDCIIITFFLGQSQPTRSFLNQRKYIFGVHFTPDIFFGSFSGRVWSTSLSSFFFSRKCNKSGPSFFCHSSIFFLPLIWLCQEKTQIWFHPEKLRSVSQKSIAVTGSLHPPWPWSTSSRECTPAATLLPQRSQSEAFDLQDESTDFECGWMNTNSQIHFIPVHTFEHTPVHLHRCFTPKHRHLRKSQTKALHWLD